MVWYRIRLYSDACLLLVINNFLITLHAQLSFKYAGIVCLDANTLTLLDIIAWVIFGGNVSKISLSLEICLFPASVWEIFCEFLTGVVVF